MSTDGAERVAGTVAGGSGVGGSGARGSGAGRSGAGGSGAGRRVRPARGRGTAASTVTVSVAVALVGLVAVAGCGGKGKPHAPKPGQAALLGTYDGSTTVGQALGSLHPNGAATDAAGTTYLLNSPALTGLSATGKGKTFPTTGNLFDATPPEGLVAMPDGSVVFGHGAEVVRLDPKSGNTSVLAGDADRTRAYNASAPATATAGDVRFTKAVTPVGVNRAGAVVLVDDRALWSLSSGRLTRVAQQPVGHGKDTTLLNVGDAVAPDGTTYLRGTKSSSTTLADVRVVSPRAGRPRCPCPHPSPASTAAPPTSPPPGSPPTAPTASTSTRYNSPTATATTSSTSTTAPPPCCCPRNPPRAPPRAEPATSTTPSTPPASPAPSPAP